MQVTMLHLVNHCWLGQHVAIYASRVNWCTCLMLYGTKWPQNGFVATFGVMMTFSFDL